MEIIDAFIPVTNTYCIDCGTETVDLFDSGDCPVHLSNIRLSNNYKVLDNRICLYMKCRKCGRIYKVRWENNTIPKPLYSDRLLNSFVNEYCNFSKT